MVMMYNPYNWKIRKDRSKEVKANKMKLNSLFAQERMLLEEIHDVREQLNSLEEKKDFLSKEISKVQKEIAFYKEEGLSLKTYIYLES